VHDYVEHFLPLALLTESITPHSERGRPFLVLIIQLALLTSHQHILQCMPSTLSGAAHARSQRNDMAHNVAFYQLDARLPAIILIILLLLLQVSRKTACASRRLECRCRRHRHRVDGSRRRDISVVKYTVRAIRGVLRREKGFQRKGESRMQTGAPSARPRPSLIGT